jgi:DUF1680 family protein
LDRTWKTGDKIELNLPMGLHIDSMPDDETIQAAMYGPLVLAGRFGTVTRDMTFSGEGPKPGTQVQVPDVTANATHPLAWIEPDPKQSLTFGAVGQPEAFDLVPLYKVIHERYAVYWKVKTS